MKLSLSQASKECGKVKSTIQKAIKDGRMSALKNDKGQYQIDPAELFRVFPKNSDDTKKTNKLEHGLSQVERQAYDAQIATMRELIDELKGERDHLRQLQIADNRKPGFWKRLVG